MEHEQTNALVTGSTDGIGVAIARALAIRGAEVIVSGRKADRGEQVVQSILAERGEARFAGADLSTPDGVHALAAAAGPVDILVNNAATNPYFGPLVDTPDAAIDKTFEVNVRGYLYGARAFVKIFGVASECGWGRTDPQRVSDLLVSHRVAAEFIRQGGVTS